MEIDDNKIKDIEKFYDKKIKSNFRLSLINIALEILYCSLFILISVCYLKDVLEFKLYYFLIIISIYILILMCIDCESSFKRMSKLNAKKIVDISALRTSPESDEAKKIAEEYEKSYLLKKRRKNKELTYLIASYSIIAIATILFILFVVLKTEVFCYLSALVISIVFSYSFYKKT